MSERHRFRPADGPGLEVRTLPSGVGALTPVERFDSYAVLRHEQNLQAARQGLADVVFLGDSITDNWGDAGRPSIGTAVWMQQMDPLHAANFGVPGDTTSNVLWRIEHGELDGQPRVVVLEVGTNNLGIDQDTPADTAAGISAVVGAIRAASPQSQVVLMDLFPRGRSSNDPLTPEIPAVNALLAHLDDGTHVHIVDLGAQFLDADGTVNRDLLPDGLHPDAQGYQIWADAIAGTLETLLASPSPAVDRVSAPDPVSAPPVSGTPGLTAADTSTHDASLELIVAASPSSGENSDPLPIAPLPDPVTLGTPDLLSWAGDRKDRNGHDPAR